MVMYSGEWGAQLQRKHAKPNADRDFAQTGPCVEVWEIVGHPQTLLPAGVIKSILLSLRMRLAMLSPPTRRVVG